jgi:RHS repeat-associated protein
MPEIKPSVPGIERAIAWAPISDPVRDVGLDPGSLYSAGRPWSAFGLTALGHEISVNVPTGGLVVNATDLSIPYHGIPLEVVRSLDSQDHYSQAAYLWSHPNTDPRFHFFANWQFQREADITPTWVFSLPEVLIWDAGAGTRLFYRQDPTFQMDSLSAADMEDRLRAYGIPGRTLAAVGWGYSSRDFLLRTLRGDFVLLTGRLEPETLTDSIDLKLWAFDAANGIARKYTSEYAYERLVDVDGRRECCPQVLLSQIVDPLGHSTSLTPISAAPPHRSYRLADGSGRSFRLDLNAYVHYLDGDQPGGEVKAYVITQLVDESVVVPTAISYSYENGLLTEVSYPGFGVRSPRIVQYRYDEAGNLITIVDPVGDTFHIEYAEDLGDTDAHLIPRLKVSKLADSAGNSVSYTYDHQNRRVTVVIAGINRAPQTVVYTYGDDEFDTRQRFITSEEIVVQLGQPQPQPVYTQWQYSTDGRLLLKAIVDPLNATSLLDYNEFNQVVATVDTTGHKRTLKYDNAASPSVVSPNHYDLIEITEDNVDATGAIFTIRSTQSFVTYDTVSSLDPADVIQTTHRVASQTDELGNVTRFLYDDLANFLPLKPTTRTDAGGQISRRTYDASGSLLTEIDPVGCHRSWVRDPHGQLLTYTDPNGFSSHWTYDVGTGWLTDVTDALGSAPGDPAHSVHYDWNDAGRPTKETDAVGVVTEFRYSANRRLASITRYDPTPQTVRTTYELSGAVATISDPNGRTTLFLYDEAGRLYQSYRDTSPSSTLTFLRDACGRVSTATDRNGQVTQYTYDPVGRIVSVVEPSWPASTLLNPGKAVTIARDKLGRALVVTDSQLPNPAIHVYDLAGNLISATDHFGWELRQDFDNRNLLSRRYDLNGTLDIHFHRDAAGNLAAVDDSSFLDPSVHFVYVRQRAQLVGNLYGIDVNQPGLAIKFDYDPNRQILGVSSRVGGVQVAHFRYIYGADHRIIEIRGDQRGRFQYDGLKRLSREVREGVDDKYDGAGNRLSRSGASSPAQSTYDTDNRLLFSPDSGISYTYDSSGNLLSEQRSGLTTRRFTYDGANRLATVDDGVHIVQYLYDIEGQLLARSESAGSVTATERYRRVGGRIVMILGADTTIRTLYSVDDEGRILRRRDAERLRPAPSSHPHSLFVLHDGLRSVCRLVDVDGVARRSEEYDPWGNPNAGGQQALRECHGYRQGYRDSRTRLINFGRRWYDTSVGRWTSQDPSLVGFSIKNANLAVGVPDFVNLYAYVGNDPLNVADLTGLGLTEWLNNLKRAVAFRVLAEFMIRRDPPTGGPGGPSGTRTERVRQRGSPEQPEGEGGEPPEPEPEYEPAEPFTSGEGGAGAAKYMAAGAGAMGAVQILDLLLSGGGEVLIPVFVL